MKWLAIIAAVLLPGALQAQFTYTNQNGAITIIGYSGPGGDVIIPGTIEGLPVVKIGTQAFYGNGSVSSVTIPNGVASLGEEVFSFCGSLTNAVLPESLAFIGNGAFGNTRLLNVTIPNSVTNIDDWAFAYCSTMTNFSIGSGVTRIGEFVFMDCSSLTNIVIPGNVKKIGRFAFYECWNLSGLTIADGVTTIAYGAFGATILTNVVIPQSVTNIEGVAFGSYVLNGITVAPLNPAYSSLDGILFDKSQTKLLQYPPARFGPYRISKGVTDIGADAFSGSSLTRITVPSSVTNIGSYAFSDSPWLAEAYFEGNIPDGCYEIFQDGPFQPHVLVYYLPGTIGWTPTLARAETVLWNPRIESNDASFGVKTNGFEFKVSSTNSFTVVIESSATFANPVWSAVQTSNTSSGSFYFTDSQTNSPNRFYRLRMP